MRMRAAEDRTGWLANHSLRPPANFDIPAAHATPGWTLRTGLRRGPETTFAVAPADAAPDRQRA